MMKERKKEHTKSERQDNQHEIGQSQIDRMEYA